MVEEIFADGLPAEYEKVDAKVVMEDGSRSLLLMIDSSTINECKHVAVTALIFQAPSFHPTYVSGWQLPLRELACLHLPYSWSRSRGESSRWSAIAHRCRPGGRGIAPWSRMCWTWL
jgi:hypothetical protein